MASGSELAWDAQGKLNEIDEDEYPDHIVDLLDDCREMVEDLAVVMEIAEGDGEA